MLRTNITTYITNGNETESDLKKWRWFHLCYFDCCSHFVFSISHIHTLSARCQWQSNKGASQIVCIHKKLPNEYGDKSCLPEIITHTQKVATFIEFDTLNGMSQAYTCFGATTFESWVFLFGIPLSAHTRNIVSSLFASSEASALLRLKWWFCILHFKQNLHEFFNENNHFRFTSMNVAIIYWLRFVRKRWKINWKQFESVTCFQLECNQESQRKQSVVCDFLKSFGWSERCRMKLMFKMVARVD